MYCSKTTDYWQTVLYMYIFFMCGKIYEYSLRRNWYKYYTYTMRILEHCLHHQHNAV